MDFPVCTQYDDVASGMPVLRAKNGSSCIILAVNYGQLAVETGLAEPTENGYVLRADIQTPITVTIRLKEAGGYYEQWKISNLVRSNVRSDYPQLTDAEYANFRPVTLGAIAPGVLYRSSSPISDEISRNVYADAAAEAAGIRFVLNLADLPEAAAAFPGFADSYCGKQAAAYLGMPLAFFSEQFSKQLAQGLRQLADHEGPYLIHCIEGKDRTGFVAAILGCLMGASLEEILDDYMVTFYNFYGVTKDSEVYALLEKNLVSNLQTLFNSDDLWASDIDLAAEAAGYLRSIGLLPAEIEAIRQHLAAQPPLLDVAEKDWFFEAAAAVREQGLLPMVSPLHFSPEGPVAADELVNALGCLGTVSDRAALLSGIRPGALNREELLAVFGRFLRMQGRYPNSSLAALFSDGTSVSPALQPDVALACGAELVQGFPDGTLRPAFPATRAQAAALLLRLSALLRK